MEINLKTQIKSTIRHQKKIFFAYWLILIIGVIIGEYLTDVSPVTEVNAKSAYVAETITILATAAVIPLALKLFSIKMNKVDWKSLTIQEGSHIYSKWSTIRLALLTVVAIMGIVTHYVYNSAGATFCTLIISFATFFCIPSKSKLEYLILKHKEEIDHNDETIA